METLKKALSSRTCWTILILFLVGGLTEVQQFVPDNLQGLVEGLLAVLAGYFRLNPRV